MTKRNKSPKSYTYPELIQKYFPGDPIAVEGAPEGLETTVTRDTFLEFLKRVNRPIKDQPQPANPKRSKKKQV